MVKRMTKQLNSSKRMKYLKFYPVFLIAIMLTNCKNTEPTFDANGHFETKEIHVFAENSGRLVSFLADAGDRLAKDQAVGMVDTTTLYLQKQQAEAGIGAALVKIPGVKAQKEVVAKEIASLDFEISRISRLVKDGAATQKNLDDLLNRKEVAIARLNTFDYQIRSIYSETNVIKAQIALIDSQIERSQIKAPISGLVLERFVSESELVGPGKILFSMAAVDEMELKAYVSGSQLSGLVIGQELTVRIDWNEADYKEYKGTINWISGEAEFTPKIIQTKEERVNLVYAIKIKVKNDGNLKIGMPGEVVF